MIRLTWETKVHLRELKCIFQLEIYSHKELFVTQNLYQYHGTISITTLQSLSVVWAPSSMHPINVVMCLSHIQSVFLH